MSTSIFRLKTAILACFTLFTSAVLHSESGITFTQQSPNLRASDAQTNDHFGYSVAIDGDTLVIGAHWSDGPGDSPNTAGSAYVFTRSGSTWSKQQILTASDAQADDEFGYSVAISGDTIVIGAPEEDGGAGDPSSNRGAAYVFTRSGSTWTEQQILNHTNGGRFGAAVAMSGETIAVGADNNRGIVHVFTRSAGTWSVEDSLSASDSRNNDRFGNAVALDADTIVVGAYAEDGGSGNPATSSGSAYVYVRSGGSWNEQQILRASDAQTNDYFGESVAVDADTIAVGAIWEDGGAGDPVTDSGSVYVFVRNGTTWQEQQKIRSSDAQGAFITGDNFGGSVAVNNDVLVIGAHYEDGGAGNPASNSGAVYVFCRDGNSWSEQQIIHAPDPNGGANFGFSIAMSGSTFVAGAFNDSWHGSTRIDSAGEAAVYNTDDITTSILDDWRFANYGTYSNSGTAADDYEVDCYTNLERYAYNLSASEPVNKVESNQDTSGSPRFYFDHAKNRLVGRYIRRKASLQPEVQYIVEVSDDQVTWTASTQAGVATSLNTDIETVEWEDEESGSIARRFVRMRIARD